jgi:hypothetical protein
LRRELLGANSDSQAYRVPGILVLSNRPNLGTTTGVTATRGDVYMAEVRSRWGPPRYGCVEHGVAQLTDMPSGVSGVGVIGTWDCQAEGQQ